MHDHERTVTAHRGTMAPRTASLAQHRANYPSLGAFSCELFSVSREAKQVVNYVTLLVAVN